VSGPASRREALRGVGCFTLFLAACLAWGAQSPPNRHKLVVLSVDGLDWRYLRDRDALGLRIPNIRRMLREGRYADGVIGVWPTVTWPSHTTILTGVRPDQHGIEGNRRPKSQGGDYYWSVDLLKARTLWQAAHERGLTTAAVTWPVTTGAAIDFNLPEYFRRRQGGSMDLQGVASKATPGLAAEIAKAFPSFPQQWVDDRIRTLAIRYLLRDKQPDLLLAHLVDLDSEEHDQGPFEQNANAVLERTDELIGEILGALPSEYDLALVSDHGFERVDKIANLQVLLTQNNVGGQLLSLGGLAGTKDPAVADFLRKAAKDPANGIGREIAPQELAQFAPRLKELLVAFEPADHVMFGAANQGPYFTPPEERGNHGFWPRRKDYRSIFVLWGPRIELGREDEMPLTAIAGRLARMLGMAPFPG
jgi:Type I phosphodiesterase / nucleotide pyrophosphatase